MNPFRAAKDLSRALRESLNLRSALWGIGPGDVVVDCGANVGRFTVPAAKTGATVFAFEPNSAAFGELKKRTAVFPNVQLFQKAVGTEEKKIQLFLHQNAGQDPVYWSTGSSLLSEKSNVSSEHFEWVEQINFVKFISELPVIPSVLKIDIEGTEVELLNRVLDSGVHKKIRKILVETHERIPSLTAPTQLLRERIARQGETHINLNWH